MQKKCDPVASQDDRRGTGLPRRQHAAVDQIQQLRSAEDALLRQFLKPVRIDGCSVAGFKPLTEEARIATNYFDGASALIVFETNGDGAIILKHRKAYISNCCTSFAPQCLD